MAELLVFQMLFGNLLMLVLFLDYKEIVCNLISPYPTAYVLEYDQATIKCAYIGESTLQLVSWEVNEIVYPLRIVDQQSHSCATFGDTSGMNRFQFNCSKDTFYWTILNVTRQDHGKWGCNVQTTSNSESNATMLYVKVPAKSISFSSPQGDPITVVENEDTPFICSTSEERPRSTIQWYIKNEVWSLGTGTISPKDNSLAETKSEFNFNFNRSYNEIWLYCSVDKSAADGRHLKSTERQITIQYPPSKPTIRIGAQIISFNVSVVKGDNVNATCESTSYPNPDSIQWTGQTKGSDLTAGNIQSTTTKNCTVTNTMTPSISDQPLRRSSTSTLTIFVMNAPTMPQFIYISSSGTNTQFTTSELAVIKGTRFQIKCSGSTSEPGPPVYSWSGNKTSSSAVIVFSTGDTSDTGSYTCHVNNIMNRTLGATETGRNNKTFRTKVLYPPSKPTIKVGAWIISSKLAVIKGDNVNATCISTSYPTPDAYQWTNQPNGSYLTISSVQASTIKNCTVTNTMTPSIRNMPVEGSASSSLEIYVMEPPTQPKFIYISPSGQETEFWTPDLSVINGTLFKIKCSEATSEPGPPSYSWSGNKTSSSDTISFASGDTSSTGSYTCHVENIMNRTFGATEMGHNSKTFKTNVLYQPAIYPLQDRNITENDPLSMVCTVSSNPSPENYTWTRAKDNFTRKAARLYIGHTRRKDTDTYTCTVNTLLRPTVGDESVGVATSSMRVTIRYHPDVLVSKANRTTITEGDLNVMLLCSATGEPEPRISKWIHYAPDGQTIVAEYSYDSDIASQAYFKLANTSYMDSGLYQCFAYNGISDFKTGHSEATGSTSLLVRARPVVIVGEKDVASAIRTNASLSVIFYSNDGNCSITWYRIKNDTRHSVPYEDGVFKVENSDIVVNVTFHRVPVQMLGNKTELFIQNISASHFGEYEAVISNNINTTVWRVNFVAQSGPDIPRQFKAVRGSITDSSIILTWISGFHGGADQTFYIQFKTPISPWENISMINGWMKTDTAFNTTVDELIPETSYSFRIFSTNEFSRSGFSTAVNVTTMRTRTAVQPDDTSKLIGPAIGGGVAGVLILSIVALIIILWRRNYTGGLAGRHNAKLLNGNKRSEETADNDNLAEVQNPMYESAGPHPISSMNTDVYAQVDKTKKNDYTTSDSKRDVYSQVQKLHKSDTAKCGKEKEQAADLYAMPVKAKGNQVHQKKEKKLKQEKKAKQGKVKGKLHGHVNEGILYENTEEFRTRTTDPDNAYELTCAESQFPSRTKNPDGLIYVEVDLPRNKDKKDNTPVVIHGLEDRNDYAEIAFGKVGEPAPDSDDEQIPKDDAKDN